jgi:hypothetical protein
MKSVLLLVVFLAGCAATAATTKPVTAPVAGTNAVVDVAAPAPSAPKETLSQKITDDGTQAIADAKAAQDIMAPQRAKCYATLLSFVPTLPALSVGSHAPAGIIDAFELAAERVEVAAEIADYQMPPAMKLAIVTDCGPLKARASDLLLLFNLKAVNFAGGVALLPK